MTIDTSTDQTLDDVVRAIEEHDGGFVVATHENPDGDAIGSMLAMARGLRARGRDVVMWHPHTPAVPADLRFLLCEDESVVSDLPADAADRVLIALDCASEQRLTAGPAAATLAGAIVNVDHHHDNGRFGTINHVDASASSTAEIVVNLFARLGWSLDRDIATALHVGIVTDTGRFSYSNVTPETFSAASRLAATGIDIAGIARRLYENTPLSKKRLLGAALTGATSALDGRLLVGVLTKDDFDRAGTGDTDGIAEALRGVQGVVVAASVRPVDGGHRVSLRSSDESVDVSAIARIEGGGGHRAAAGLTTSKTPSQIVTWLADEVGRQLDG